MPSRMTIRWLRTELQAAESPQMWNYKRTTNMSSRSVVVKVMLKYMLVCQLWSICQVPWRSVGCKRSYSQGNSLRCEIRNAWRTWVLDRLWSKWHRHIHYCVTSEVYDNSHDERLAMHGATSRGIPSDAKFQLKIVKHNCMLQVQFLSVSGQTEFQIYIIGSTLNYMRSPMTIARTWMELQAGEFP